MQAIKQAMRKCQSQCSSHHGINFSNRKSDCQQFDWFYSLAGQTSKLANNLITRQDAAGSWMDSSGCTGGRTPSLSAAAVTAFASIVLSKPFRHHGRPATSGTTTSLSAVLKLHLI